jgi:nucleoside-diphosphate-sugar epimerase
MSAMLFTKAIAEGRPIDVFNHGQMQRDFTYIDDIVEGVVRVMDHIPAGDPAFDAARPDPATSHAPWRVFNIGNPFAGATPRIHRDDRSARSAARPTSACCRCSRAT